MFPREAKACGHRTIGAGRWASRRRLEVAALALVAALGAAFLVPAPEALHRRSVALNVLYGLDKPAG